LITPNLATRPFLNTRQVWLVAGAAGVLAIILTILNVRLYLASTTDLGAELTRRDELEERYLQLETEVRADVDALQKVPWRTLSGRVQATNLILHQHSFLWLQMLDDIEAVMPWDVRLTQIAPSVGPDEAALTLQVVAQSRPALLKFLENLLDDPRFAEPTPRTEKTPEETEAVGYVMSLRVIYLPSGETS
jgi:Tfp pilus assembly protein PilN